MEDKKVFIQRIQDRTKKYAVDIIKLCEDCRNTEATRVIKYQIIKSCTSVAANYRAVCISRSKKEFFSKLCIVVEEADETQFWLELIEELKICKSNDELSRLQLEAKEICKILTAAKKNCFSQ